MKEAFNKLLSFSNKKIVLLTHTNADLDAICSAYGLSFLFPNSIIALNDDLNKPAKLFVEKYNIKIKKIEEIKKEDYEGVIVIDAGSYKMVEKVKGWKILGIIDHHKKSEFDINEGIIIKDDNARATCEILSRLIEKPNKQQALAFAVGIISDTARFKTALPETFKEMEKCLKISGETYEKLLEIAMPERTKDEKINILKSIKNMEFYEHRGKVIVLTTTKLNESDVASVLSEVADISIVINEKENGCRVSARARHHCKIKLNEIMKELGKKYEGNGGGHTKAAGAFLRLNKEKALKTCLNHIINAIDAEMAER